MNEHSKRSRGKRHWLSLAAVIALAAPAKGQYPTTRLYSVFPPGGKQGTTFDVTVTGEDQDELASLHFSRPGITAKPKFAEPGPFDDGPRQIPNQFVVAIDPKVPIGNVDVRAVGKYGLSNARVFQIGDLPETLEKEPNNTLVEATPIAFGSVANGVSSGSEYDWYKFPAKKGTRVFVECQAEQIDSRMNPTIVLYDHKGIELAKSRDAIRSDALIDYDIPADGDYFVKVQDATFAGGAEYFYRLKVSSSPQIDYVVPPAALAGTTGTFELFGRNLPGGTKVPNALIDGRPIEKLSISIAIPGGEQAAALETTRLVRSEEAFADAFEYRLVGPVGQSNPVFIGIAQSPLVAEVEPNDAALKAQRITPPCEVYGSFYPERDKDIFAFDAKAGEAWWLDVVSQRMGQPTDPHLVIERVLKDDKGMEQIQEIVAVDESGQNDGFASFNTRTDDPSYRLAVPADGSYRVRIRDLYSAARGDLRYQYRLAIRKETPDFRFVVHPRYMNNGSDRNQTIVWSTVLRRGGTELLDVVVYRQDGFDGEIEIGLEGLPKGVTCAPIEIGPQKRWGTLVLVANDDAADFTGTIRAVGKATLPAGSAVRPGRFGAVVWQANGNRLAQSRLTAELGLSVLGSEAAPYFATLGAGKMLETSRISNLEIPLTIVRRGDFKGSLQINQQGQDLPPNCGGNNFTINPDATTGTFTLNIQSNTPSGTYTLNLQVDTQANYRRNPEAAKAAADRKDKLEKIVADATTAKNAADEGRRKAERDLNEAKAAHARSVDMQRGAEQEAKRKGEQAKAAADRARQAAEASEKAPNDAGLKQTKEAAARQSAEANTAHDAAMKAFDEKTKIAADAAEKVKTADADNAAADKTLADAEAKLRAATDARNQAQQFANELANRASPRNINVFQPTTPVTVKITEAPITFALPDLGKVKQGQKLEVPLAIKRLYGFNEPVYFQLEPPGGVGGLGLPGMTIEKDKSDGKFTIDANQDATPGSHTLNLRISLNWFGKNLQWTQPARLTVEKVEKK